MSGSSSYGNENDINLRLVIGFNRSNTGIQRAVQQYLKEYGITLPQFSVLEALYHRGEMMVCDLIQKTLSTSGNMTVVLKNLEKESYVARRQSPQDKRISVISLTDTGRDLIQQAFDGHLGIIARQFERLTAEEKDELNQLIRRMNGIT